MIKKMPLVIAFGLLAPAGVCIAGDKPAEAAKGTAPAAPAEAKAKSAPTDADKSAPKTVESKDILARAPETQSADVLHVLVSWKDLAPTYAGRGGQDPRGAARTREEADALALEIAKKAATEGQDFKKLMAEYSEDPGSAKSGITYTATPEAGLVPPFKNLSLRLKVGEVGVVETAFGWHIIKRAK